MIPETPPHGAPEETPTFVSRVGSDMDDVLSAVASVQDRLEKLEHAQRASNEYAEMVSATKSEDLDARVCQLERKVESALEGCAKDLAAARAEIATSRMERKAWSESQETERKLAVELFTESVNTKIQSNGDESLARLKKDLQDSAQEHLNSLAEEARLSELRRADNDVVTRDEFRTALKAQSEYWSQRCMGEVSNFECVISDKLAQHEQTLSNVLAKAVETVAGTKATSLEAFSHQLATKFQRDLDGAILGSNGCAEPRQGYSEDSLTELRALIDENKTYISRFKVFEQEMVAMKLTWTSAHTALKQDMRELLAQCREGLPAAFSSKMNQLQQDLDKEKKDRGEAVQVLANQLVLGSFSRQCSASASTRAHAEIENDGNDSQMGIGTPGIPSPGSICSSFAFGTARLDYAPGNPRSTSPQSSVASRMSPGTVGSSRAPAANAASCADQLRLSIKSTPTSTSGKRAANAPQQVPCPYMPPQRSSMIGSPRSCNGSERTGTSVAGSAAGSSTRVGTTRDPRGPTSPRPQTKPLKSAPQIYEAPRRGHAKS